MMYKLDPFNDNVAKMIIEYYGSQGKKSKLETFFNNYVENLWKEMNLRPLDSTNDLYRKYLKKWNNVHTTVISTETIVK